MYLINFMKDVEIRNLPSYSSLELGDRARQGDPQAVRDFVSFAVWQRICVRRDFSDKEKELAHETLMNSVNIKVVKDG